MSDAPVASPRATASMAALTSGRRPGAMTLSAAVSVSPSARWSASSLASVPVSSRPRCLAGECGVWCHQGQEFPVLADCPLRR